MNLFYTERFPIKMIEERLVVPGMRGSHPADIWNQWRTIPMPGWESARDATWFAQLKADIVRLGVRHPVLLWDCDEFGLCPVKGASRLRACRELDERYIPVLISTPLDRETADGKWGHLRVVQDLHAALSYFPLQAPELMVWRKSKGKPFYAEFPTWRDRP